MEKENKEKGRFKFPKEERLRHKSLVERLFREGESFYEFPFRINWQAISEEALERNFKNYVPEGIGGLQLLVTVPKKKRKRAVDRVLLRRRIREAYRLNRLPLKQIIENSPEIRTFSLSLVYIHDKTLSYHSIERKIQTILQKIENKIIEPSPS